MPRTAKRKQPARQAKQKATPEEVKLPGEAVVEVVTSRSTPNKRKSSPLNDEEAEETQESPTSPKRQKLAVRTRSESVSDGHRRTHIEAEFIRGKQRRGEDDAVMDSEADGEDEEKEEEEEDVEPLSASKQLIEEASQRSAAARVAETPLKPKRPAGKQSGKKHVVFGDDNDIEKYVATAATASLPVEEANEEEEGSDDDDEAPEALSNKAAGEQSLKTLQSATEAADRQAESQKRKRQKRDALLKEQGASARKRVKTSSLQKNDQTDSDFEVIKNKLEPAAAGSTFSKKYGRYQVPDVLPAEFLEDSSSDEDEDYDEAAFKVAEKPQKITFHEAERLLAEETRAPRDEVAGSTVFRVVRGKSGKERQDLAPRALKQSRNLKNDMLMRNRGKVTAVVGKKKGFFAKQ